MANPLDENLAAYNTAVAAFKVVRRVLDGRRDPLSNTDFDEYSEQKSREVLDRVEEYLEKLVAFALFATFERTLRDHVNSNLTPVQNSTTVPSELAAALHKFLCNDSDHWYLDSVIEMFAPPVPDQDVANAKGIRTLRHHVAHGAAPPTSIPPRTVYRQLSDFLQNAGLI
ncbi:MAG: hypothetical protein ABIH23_23665 [bacterium]